MKDVFDRLAKEKTIRKIYIKSNSKKYISSGTKPRIKNILNKNLEYKKDEIVSLFYKNELVAVGKMLEDFPSKNTNPAYEETENIQLIKVFS